MNDRREQPQAPNTLTIVVAIAASVIFFGAILRVALQPNSANEAAPLPKERASSGTSASELAQAENTPTSKDKDAGPQGKDAIPNGQTPENEGAKTQHESDPNDAANETDAGQGVAGKVDPPWVDQLEQAPTSWASQAFRRFDTKASLPLVAELKQWFQSAPLSPAPRFRTTNTSAGKCGVFQGVMRLAAPLESPAALRLDLTNNDKLKIHAFQGNQGVTFVQYSNSQWVAYETQRHAGAPRPARLRLTATDDQRAVRTSFGKGPFEVCFLPGEIALTRGNIVLLRAPFKGLPGDVFLEGSASFQGISIRRLNDAPPQDRELTPESTAPGRLTWITTAIEQGQTNTTAEGGIGLSSNAASTKHGRIWAALHDSVGLSVVDLKLSNVAAGAGVYLADQSGTPRYQLRFVRNTRNGELGVAVRADYIYELDLDQFENRKTASVGENLWVRFATGGGQLRSWISVNGRHWANLGVVSHGKTSIESIGLSYVAKSPKASIQIDQIRINRLSGIRNLARPELLSKAIACSKPTMESWHVDTIRSLPKNAPLDDWRLATAIRALEHWSSAPLSDYLMWTVLRTSLQRDRPTPDLLAALDDASLVLNLSSDAALVQYSELFEQLALKHADAQEGEQAVSFGDVLHRMFSTPLLTSFRMRPPSQHWLQQELLRQVYRRDWERLNDFLRVLKFYHWESLCPLTPWAEAMALRAGPIEADSGVGRSSRANWRPTIVEDLDREAFNRISELEAALQTESFADAADIAASIRDTSSTGVAPAAGDATLLQSVSAALQDVLSRYPAVATALEQQHREVAQLRLQRAMDNSDAAAVRTISEQFGEMEPAARARLWLGDRNLSTGRFEEALADYQQAARCIDLTQESARRIELAQAMLGRTETNSQPADKPSDVVFADARFSAAEYKTLVGGLAQSHKPAALPTWQLSPVDFEIHFAGKLDGQLGKSPNQAVVRGSTQIAGDWPIRQLAHVRDGNTLYVSNRFQIAAYQLGDGKRLWTSEKALGEPLRSQDWFLTRTKPLVGDDALYGRFLYGAGPRLVKLNRKDGKLLWATPSSSSLFIVSDPFFWNGKLLALVVNRGQQQSQLSIAEFDTESGAIRIGRRLLDLRDRWWKLRYCNVVTQPDGLIISLGGAIAFSDYQGRIRWLRRQPQIPIELDPTWMGQSFGPPSLDGQAICYVLPASKELVCLERGTGRIRWRKLMPDIKAVAAAVDGKVFVQTAAGLTCFAARNGNELWQYDDPDLDATMYFQGPRAMLVRSVKSKPRRQQREPQIVWLNLNTGKTEGFCALPGLNHPRPQIGPIILGPANAWVFLATSVNDADLDLLRLQPKGVAAKVRSTVTDAWTDHPIDSGLRESFGNRLPNWRLWLGDTVHANGIVPSIHGKKKQLALRLSQQKSLVLAAQKPIGPRKQLVVKMGHNTAMQWKLDVLSNGRRVFEQTITKESHPDFWITLNIPWAKFPESAWVVLRFSHVSGTEGDLYLESLEFE